MEHVPCTLRLKSSFTGISKCISFPARICTVLTLKFYQMPANTINSALYIWHSGQSSHLLPLWMNPFFGIKDLVDVCCITAVVSESLFWDTEFVHHVHESPVVLVYGISPEGTEHFCDEWWWELYRTVLASFLQTVCRNQPQDFIFTSTSTDNGEFPVLFHHEPDVRVDAPRGSGTTPVLSCHKTGSWRHYWYTYMNRLVSVELYLVSVTQKAPDTGSNWSKQWSWSDPMVTPSI